MLRGFFSRIVFAGKASFIISWLMFVVTFTEISVFSLKECARASGMLVRTFISPWVFSAPLRSINEFFLLGETMGTIGTPLEWFFLLVIIFYLGDLIYDSALFLLGKKQRPVMKLTLKKYRLPIVLVTVVIIFVVGILSNQYYAGDVCVLPSHGIPNGPERF